MGKRFFLGVLGFAVLAFGVDVRRDDAPGVNAKATEGMPLRFDLRLIEHARATEAPAEAAAASLRLCIDAQMRPPPDEAPGAAQDGRPLVATGVQDAKAVPPPGSVRLDLLARSRDIGELGEMADPFGPKSWVIVPPPPPPPPPAPVVAPRAPPFPFRFMRQLDDGLGSHTYFLARGTAMIPIAVGGTIDNTYLLERAEDGTLHFTYLPLRERQSLQTGGVL